MIIKRKNMFRIAMAFALTAGLMIGGSQAYAQDITKKFEDPYFRAVVQKMVGSKKITKANIKKIKVINTYDKVWKAGKTDKYGSTPLMQDKIASLKGIEYMTNLREIRYSPGSETNKRLKTVDLSKNTKLESVLIGLPFYSYGLDGIGSPPYASYIKNIKLPKSNTLKSLEIGTESLSKIDLKGIPNVENLVLCGVNMNGIDISNNTKIKTLVLNGLKMETVDLSKNTKIENLIVQMSEINRLDIGHLPSLKTLVLDYTKGLKALDISNNTNLEEFSFVESNLNNIYFKPLKKLKLLWIMDAKLKSIDLSENTMLENLNLGRNNIKEVNLSNLKNLKILCLSLNEISKIDIRENILLEELDLSNNKLTAIDISNNKKLIRAHLYENGIKSSKDIKGFDKNIVNFEY